MKQLHTPLRWETVRCGALLSFVVFFAFQAVPAFGQEDADEREHQRNLRDAIRKEERRTKFNVEAWLKDQDTNKDGVLTPEEVTRDRTRRYINDIGIKFNSAKPISTMVKELNASRQEKTDKKRREFERKLITLDSFGAESESQGVASFGVEQKGEGVVSFADRNTGLRVADFEPEQLREAEKLLKSFDRDKNGVLDGDEIGRVVWAGQPPESSDINRDGRLSKLELAKRFEQRSQTKQKTTGGDRPTESERYRSERESGRGKPDRDFKRDYSKRDRDGSDSDGDYSKKDRYKRDRDASNRRTSTPSVKATASAATTAAPSKPRDINKKLQKYLNEKFTTYDANKDGRLDEDEVAKSRMFQKAVDENEDGFLDKSEALVFISGGKKKSPSPKPKTSRFGKTKSIKTTASSRTSPSSRMSASSRSTASSKGNSGRKSLDGLDKDKDGQIQMHEFTEDWTADKLQEFRDKDKNGDRILSATEWNE